MASLPNRQWTLTIFNEFSADLVAVGTSESSLSGGSLITPLTVVESGKMKNFIWKNTNGATRGAIGAIHFRIGDTGKFLSVFGCIPADMKSDKAGCNIDIDPQKASSDDLETGQDGCQNMLDAGKTGERFGCTYLITNEAEAVFMVWFNYKP